MPTCASEMPRKPNNPSHLFAFPRPSKANLHTSHVHTLAHAHAPDIDKRAHANTLLH